MPNPRPQGFFFSLVRTRPDGVVAPVGEAPRNGWPKLAAPSTVTPNGRSNESALGNSARLVEEQSVELPQPGSLLPGVCALVHTFNEERQIADCLRALGWCDEILLVDSYSTDRTVEIAASFAGVRVVQHEYHGAAAQKNWAMRMVRYEWTLIFDADERCSAELRDEILQRLAKRPQEDFFVIHRRTHYLGQLLRFSGFQNDRVTRLMRTGIGRYQNRRVHARVIAPDGRLAERFAPVLEHSMDHHMVVSLPHHFERVRRYAYWGAAQAYRDGKGISMFGVLRRSIWRFLRTYFLQLGFLDGGRGLIFCSSQAVGSFMKWAILWSWRKADLSKLPVDLPSFDDNPSTWRCAKPTAMPEAPAAPQASRMPEVEVR